MIHKTPHPSPNNSPFSDKKRAAQTAICTTPKADMSAQLNSDYSTQISTCQESTEKELIEVFTPKRMFSELLSESFSRLSLDSRAYRTAQCGTILKFSHGITDQGLDPHGHLAEANFCRDRLCPQCSHRRAMKIFSQVSKIMTHMGNSFEYLFLTLTVPNCSPDELDNTLTRLFKAFDRLMKRRNVKRAVHGFFRALEVTRNDEHDTYHPHFHCVLAVNPSYFHKADYIPQSEWLQMWRDAYGDQSITQVDVRKAKPKKSTFDELGNLVSNDLGSVVAEVAKYTVKSSDYIFPNDPEKTDRVINVLAGALKSRRLVQYGGIFKKLHKELNLSDPEDGDLINVTDELHPALAHIILTYSWSIGAYKLMSREFLSIDAKQFIPDAPEGSVIHLDLDKPFPLAQITAAEWCGASQDEWTELYESATTEDD